MRGRRSLGVALWSLAGLLACFLGALSALVGTGAGRELLARAAEKTLARVLAGTIDVGEIRGTLLTGVTLTDVRLFDNDTTLVAWLPYADVTYNPFDIVGGRVALLSVELRQPFIHIVQRPDGRLNFEELFRLGRRGAGSQRPAPLILFRNVTITQGKLTLQMRDIESPDDSLHEIVQLEPGDRRRLRRFQHLDARFNTLRLSSPYERGVLMDIQRLAVVSSDPEFVMVDARGRVVVVGDSLEADLAQLRLTGSSLAAKGRVRWPQDTLLYDLDLAVDSGTLADFRFIDRRFPDGAVLRGDLQLRSRGARVLEVRLDPLDVAYHGGTLSGHVTSISSAGQGVVALRQADLMATEMDLELARPFLDTLPFAGRLTGRTEAEGRLTALDLHIDWVFRDSLVEGWPVTRVEGRGEMDLMDAEGLAFHDFMIDAGQVDLATVHRLIPEFLVRGSLDGTGTLNGPYTNAEFQGTLRHHHAGPTSTRLRGMVRLDSRTDTLGVFVDVVADTLSFEELKASFPGMPLVGTAAGTVRLAGPRDRLDTHFDLTAPGGGRVRGDGEVTLLDPEYGARDFTLRADDVNLARWVRGAPVSRLSGAISGSVEVDSGTPRAGRMVARLDPSLFAGSVIDSGSAVVGFGDGQLVVEALRIQQSGMITTGHGALSWSRPARGTLAFEFDADRLASLDSVLGWLADRAGAPRGLLADPLRGSARASFVLSGSIDSLEIGAQVSAPALQWRAWTLTAGDAKLLWRAGPAAGFDLELAADSITRGVLDFGAAAVALHGTRDSLAWFARSRWGDVAAFLAGGRFAPGSDPGGSRVVAVDSLALLLPGGVWFLDAPTRIAFGDSTLWIASATLTRAGAPGRLSVAADLPPRGPASARLQLEHFPVAGVYALLQRDTLGVGGFLTATLSVAGTRAAPVSEGAFSLTDGAFGRFRTPFVDGTATYRDRRLDGAVRLWRSGQEILTLTAHLPLNLALQAVDRRQLPDTLWVRARADSVDLTLLEALTPLVRGVHGGLTADVGIRGTWNAPLLSGAVRIVDAGAFIPALNVRYDGVNGYLALSRDMIRLESITARGGEGTARVSGTVQLRALTRPVLDLAIDAQQFRALDLPNFLTMTASGHLELTGPVFGAELTGRGTVTSGVWYFADLIQKRVVDIEAPWASTLIDTTLAATIRSQRLGPEFQSVFLDSLRIRDLELEMGSDMWLRSTEANIQLTGIVRASKRGSDYTLTGTLQAPRGVYRLTVGPVSRDFTVTRGTVRYFGTPDLDAQLDIEARHVVRQAPGQSGGREDVTIIARIGGTLLVPRLTLEAEGRELAQNEIISYLLFGKPFENDPSMANQNALIGNALASVYGELERTLVSDLGVPLDYVEIRPSDPASPFSGAQLAAGWQIGEKTFLVVRAGFCGGPNVEVSRSIGRSIGASLQFRISPEWRAEASYEPVLVCGSTGQQSSLPQNQLGLDLFWERRF